MPLNKYLLPEEVKVVFFNFESKIKRTIFYNCKRRFNFSLISFETSKNFQNYNKNTYVPLFMNSESFLTNILFSGFPFKFFVKVKKTMFYGPVLRVCFSFAL